MFLKLHNLKSILGHNLHYIGTAALGVGALALAQPWMIAVGAISMTALTALSVVVSKHVFEEKLEKHPDSHRFSPNLKHMVESLYKQTGLDPRKAAVYDFKAKRDNTDEDGAWDKMFDKMSKLPNAAAFSMGKPVIMISEPLLELLDDDEEYAVLAHEFAHAGAKHQHIAIPHKLLSSVIKASASLASITEMVNAGWVGLPVSLYIGGIASNVATRLHPNGNLMKEKKGFAKIIDEMNPNLEEKVAKKEVKKLAKLARTVATVGAISAFNSKYIPVYATAKAINLSATFLEKSFSRSKEYQADRGATILGANPLALITSLRKLTAVQRRSLEQAWKPNKIPEKSKIQQAWKKSFSTHPTLTNRIDRLVNIAREKGFSEEDIKFAVKGPLIIPDTVNIPRDQIVAMAEAIIGEDDFAISNDNSVNGNSLLNFASNTDLQDNDPNADTHVTSRGSLTPPVKEKVTGTYDLVM